MIDHSQNCAPTRSGPLQVWRRLGNGDALRAWAQSQRLPFTVREDDLHVTIAYSRASVDWSLVPPDLAPLEVRGGSRALKLLGPGRDALVLSFVSPQLAERFETFRRAGATWDWPDYQPHITIAYDLRDAEVANAALAAVAYAGLLLFDGEQFAPVKV